MEGERTQRHNIKTTLYKLGFGEVIDTINFIGALEKLSTNVFTHLLFDAKGTGMSASTFLEKVFIHAPAIIAIPSSTNPALDDVFDLIMKGARSYLRKPITAEALETALIIATKIESIDPKVAGAKDRNEALAMILLAAIDKAALLMRNIKSSNGKELPLPFYLAQIRSSAEFARAFAKDGDTGLFNSIEEKLLESAQNTENSLKRIAEKIQQK